MNQDSVRRPFLSLPLGDQKRRSWPSCSLSGRQRLIISQRPLLLPTQLSVPPLPFTDSTLLLGLGASGSCPLAPGTVMWVSVTFGRGAWAGGGQEGGRLGAQSAAPASIGPGLLPGASLSGFPALPNQRMPWEEGHHVCGRISRQPWCSRQLRVLETWGPARVCLPLLLCLHPAFLQY